jgi:hypothetical protein
MKKKDEAQWACKIKIARMETEELKKQDEELKEYYDYRPARLSLSIWRPIYNTVA